MCGLWPATPSKPRLAFTLELMDMVHCLVLECQTSLHDVVNFLKISGKTQPEVSLFNSLTAVYSVFIGLSPKDKEFYKLLTMTFPQYRYVIDD